MSMKTIELISNKVEQGKALNTEENAILFASKHHPNVRRLIILGNQGIVKAAATKYKGDQEYDDLLQEGNVALIDAVSQFAPERNRTFYTYAFTCISRRMASYMLQNRRLISVPWHAYPKKDEYESLKLPLRSLDERIKGEDTFTELKDVIPGEINIEEEIVDAVSAERNKEKLQEIMKCLTDIERQVIESHYGLCGQEKKTLSQIARDRCVSHQSVSSTERRAIRKMRKAWDINYIIYHS